MDIEKLRKERKLSQQDLSDATGIPKGRINAWEQRKIVPPKKEDYEILKTFFEYNSSQSEDENQNEKNNKSIDSSLSKLIDSNKTLADAHKIFAESNLKLANTNERLSIMLQNSTGYDGSKNQIILDSKIDRVLEAISELLSGAYKHKKTLNFDEIYGEMRKIVFSKKREDELEHSLEEAGI